MATELGYDRVREAKAKEIKSFKDRRVYDVADRSEYLNNPQAIMLSTKWARSDRQRMQG